MTEKIDLEVGRAVVKTDGGPPQNGPESQQRKPEAKQNNIATHVIERAKSQMP
ncbi:MAG TPA: hypothetical protein VII05_05390 [Gaiellaceae bacterium]